MSKNSHKSTSSQNNGNIPNGTSNIFTRKQGQSLIRDNMVFAHNLLHSKDTIPGILTVATTQARLTGELTGEGALHCVHDQYYMLLVSAISTILAAMDEHGALKNLGLNTEDLSFEALGFIVGAIEDKLGLEIGDDEELDRLIEKDDNIFEFLDTHYASLLRLGAVDDED